jgi:hypothetical protein
LHRHFKTCKVLLQLHITVRFGVNFVLGLEEAAKVPIYQSDFVNPVDKIA